MPQKDTYLSQIDIIRGIAVIMMLTNHAAVRWLDFYGNNNGISGCLSFIGSFAPVMFFFATGLGYGASHRIGYHGDYRNVLFKATILIIMDGFMCQRFTIIAGWDFLAFIAFSMIVLLLIKDQYNAVPKALFAAIFFALFKFIGTLIYRTLGLKQTWLAIAIGLGGIESISYWFAPWFTYPFVGFIIGAMIVKWSDLIQQKKALFISSAAATGTLIGLVSFYLYNKGAIYFRWGTMSINYFIASFSVIAFILVIAYLFPIFTQLRKIIQAISMRGISSLAVVPVHYFILGMIDIVAPGTLKPKLFYGILPFWLFMCMYAAKIINRYTTILSTRLVPASGLYLLLILIIIAVVLSLEINAVTKEVLTLMAQLTLCLLLASPLNSFIRHNEKLSDKS